MATVWSDENSMHYHLKQWSEIKESTKGFISFLGEDVLKGQNYLDLGCGAGAATYALSKQYADSNWVGIDLDAELIATAVNFSKMAESKNLSFTQGNLEEFGDTGTYEGIVSLQTLSWLEDFRGTFDNVFRDLQPSWFALTSLFYEGNISAYTRIHEHGSNRKLFYNTYSIPQLKEVAKEYGYYLERYEPFEIELDLPRPSNLDLMGTFTKQVIENDSITRLQISGPLLMSWYMLLFRRI